MSWILTGDSPKLTACLVKLSRQAGQSLCVKGHSPILISGTFLKFLQKLFENVSLSQIHQNFFLKWAPLVTKQEILMERKFHRFNFAYSSQRAPRCRYRPVVAAETTPRAAPQYQLSSPFPAKLLIKLFETILKKRLFCYQMGNRCGTEPKFSKLNRAWTFNCWARAELELSFSNKALEPQPVGIWLSTSRI